MAKNKQMNFLAVGGLVVASSVVGMGPGMGASSILIGPAVTAALLAKSGRSSPGRTVAATAVVGTPVVLWFLSRLRF